VTTSPMAPLASTTSCSRRLLQCQLDRIETHLRLPKRLIAHHGSQDASAPLDADNKLGSSPAVRSDWHSGVADFHLGTGYTVPTQDAGYTTASELPSRQTSISLYLRGESIYGLLGCIAKLHLAHRLTEVVKPRLVARSTIDQDVAVTRHDHELYRFQSYRNADFR